MFDIGFFELVIIFVLGLLVLGPERLPKVARTAGRFVGKARSMARNLQYELEREVDLKDLRDIQSDLTGDKHAAPTKPDE